MADINQVITLGIGTPSSIAFMIRVGLGQPQPTFVIIGGANPTNYRTDDVTMYDTRGMQSYPIRDMKDYDQRNMPSYRTREIRKYD